MQGRKGVGRTGRVRVAERGPGESYRADERSVYALTSLAEPIGSVVFAIPPGPGRHG